MSHPILFFILTLSSLTTGSFGDQEQLSDEGCAARSQALLQPAAAKGVQKLQKAGPAELLQLSWHGHETIRLDVWTRRVEIPSLVALVAGLLGIVCFGEKAATLPKSVLSVMACAVYVLISITIDVSIVVQRNSGSGATYHFDPMKAVIIVEVVKLLASCCIIGAKRLVQNEPPSATESKLRAADVAWLLLPAAFFALNNVLVWFAIGKNDASTFGVFRDTLILWTASLWRIVFDTPLGVKRIASLGIIVLGLLINQSGVRSWSVMALWVLAMTCCNALASVFNELAMKRNEGLDINVQNAVLYMECLCITVLIILASGDRHSLNPGSFFEGFTHHTMFTVTLQACAGLMVSRILKYADSVQKNVASCLRGPLLVVLAPVFVASRDDWLTLASAAVVATGCCFYLVQGPVGSMPKLQRQ